MATTTEAPLLVVKSKQVTCSEKTTLLIKALDAAWAPHTKDILAIGKIVSDLRAETKAYQKDNRTGLTFNGALQKARIPRSSALLYAKVYDFCTDSNLKPDTFFAFYDQGLSLASPHLNPAGEAGVLSRFKSILTMDPTDGDAVEKMVDRIKDAFAREPREGIKATVALILSLTRDLKRNPPEGVAASIRKELAAKEAQLKNQLAKVESDVRKRLAELAELRSGKATQIAEDLLEWIARIA